MKLIGQRNTIETDKPIIMGIVNITPDSFSQDGVLSHDEILKTIEDHLSNGAMIIDIGAESSRPFSERVSSDEELKRLFPIFNVIRKKFPNVFLSVDTYKPEVAEEVLNCGADMINDIKGLREKGMAEVIAKYHASLVIMHMQNDPKTMQIAPVYNNVVIDICKFLKDKTKLAIDSGINSNSILIDPGIGFGKTIEHNLSLLKNLKKISEDVRYPLLVGTSRKGFIAKILQSENFDDRDIGTLATSVWAIQHGASVIRVHNSQITSQALKVIEAIGNGFAIV